MLSLFLTAALSTSPAMANGAQLSTIDIEHDECVDLLIFPPPGSGYSPIPVEHCVTFEGTRRILETPSGLRHDTFSGEMSFEDYDGAGNLVSDGAESVSSKTLTRSVWDGEDVLVMRKASVDSCIDTPWGFAITFSLDEAFANGELRVRTIERDTVDSCD